MIQIYFMRMVGSVMYVYVGKIIDIFPGTLIGTLVIGEL